MGTGIIFQRGVMDEARLRLTTLTDSSTQLLHLCGLSGDLYAIFSTHSSSYMGLILCQQMLTNVRTYVCIPENLKQFIGFSAARRRAPSLVPLLHSSKCYRHTRLDESTQFRGI